MHSTRDPSWDLHIPPGILYPTYKNIVLLFLFSQKIFVRVPILMDHPRTYLKLSSENVFKTRLVISEKYKLSFFL